MYLNKRFLKDVMKELLKQKEGVDNKSILFHAMDLRKYWLDK